MQSGFTFLTQAVSAIAGFIIVRNVAKEDYGSYAIALALTAIVAIAAEAGTNATLLTAGGRIHRGAQIALLNACLAFRRRFAVIATLFAVPLGTLVMNQSGVSLLEAVALTAAGCLAAYVAARSSLTHALLRLDYEFGWSGGILLASAALRVLALWALVTNYSGHYAVVGVTLLAAAASQFEGAAAARRLATGVTRDDGPDHDWSQLLMANARRFVPVNLFFAFSAQFLGYVLPLIGSRESLAEITAVGRFGIAFSLLSVTLSGLVAPIIARQQSVERALQIYVMSSLAYVVASILTLISVWAAAPWLLLLLGDGYSDLKGPLVLVSAAAALGGLAGFLSVLNSARSWLRRTWIAIPLTSAWMAILLVTVGLESTENAALFVALSPLLGSAVPVLCALWGAREELRSRDSYVAG
jgi:hypothetical protein